MVEAAAGRQLTVQPSSPSERHHAGAPQPTASFDISVRQLAKLRSYIEPRGKAQKPKTVETHTPPNPAWHHLSSIEFIKRWS
jgi:hypothetical protein